MAIAPKCFACLEGDDDNVDMYTGHRSATASTNASCSTYGDAVTYRRSLLRFWSLSPAALGFSGGGNCRAMR